MQRAKVPVIGNTNSRYRFPIGARAFVERWNEQGPAHHCAVGVGHLSDRITKLGALLSMDVVRVCQTNRTTRAPSLSFECRRPTTNALRTPLARKSSVCIH